MLARPILPLALLILLLYAGAGHLPASASTDTLAKTVLDKAGVRATVCEMPRAGDGTLAATLTRAGVAQVHALAPDAKAAEAARKPATDAGVCGSQVIVETGTPDALPLGDWVADLYLVADATDANLKSLSATEAGRVLSPYRGVALVGNPGGAKAGLSKQALAAWAKDTSGTATIDEDASGLWVLVKMPPLKGGDDWGHFYHGPDGNPVSKDTAFVGSRYQLQWHDLPIQGERNYTTVVSAGRLFMATCSLYWGNTHWWMRPCQPVELEARSLYNAKVLWRRPISASFGDMASLLVARPDRLYAKDSTGVLVLDPETGAELRRFAATEEPKAVRWITLTDGVLLTLVGPKPFNAESADVNLEPAHLAAREREYCQELTAWDEATGKQLWQFKDAAIDPKKLAVNAGHVYLYVNDKDALCLDQRSGKELWRTAAPSTPMAAKEFEVRYEGRGEMTAIATPKVYLIFDLFHGQNAAFGAADGHMLWSREKAERYPLVFGDTLLNRGSVQCDLVTGQPVTTYAQNNPFRSQGDSCGHTTALDSGLWIGGGVWDMKAG